MFPAYVCGGTVVVKCLTNWLLTTPQDRVDHITELLKEAQARRMPSSLVLQPPGVTAVDKVDPREARQAAEAGRDLVPVEMYHFLEVCMCK